MLGSVQISGEDIGDVESSDICSSLRQNTIRLLSIRGCRIQDKNFRQMMESIKENTSLSHLNLNLGIVNSKERIIWFSESLKGNTGICTLLYVIYYYLGTYYYLFRLYVVSVSNCFEQK